MKAAVAAPMASQYAEMIINLFIDHGVSQHEALDCLHSDMVFQSLFKTFRIKKTRTTSGNPQGNCQVERNNQTFTNLLKAFSHEHHPEDWDRHLGGH